MKDRAPEPTCASCWSLYVVVSVEASDGKRRWYCDAHRAHALDGLSIGRVTNHSDTPKVVAGSTAGVQVEGQRREPRR